ncbi:GNAT family N-acetyltransferase [Algicella marina]|uniref:GNAT family N-acetyltransferase n=1 Tax=Algicella marina TaxID=2683284 RepID=A0A6P1STB1_9RHOB|nr:GNAT family N-acetyltransferase [Algicella marina]QHQ33914.1 GNAT family N-acetyltransferase [Algicella marina]
MPVRRPATTEDCRAIAQIWNRIIRETATTFTTAEKAAKDIPLTNTHVLADGDTVLGFTTRAPFRAGPGYLRTHEITIYLAEGARGGGLGVALLRPLEEEAREAGIHSLIAGLAGKNAPARAFFLRHGFIEVGLIPEAGWKFGDWHDLRLLQKRL